MSHINEKAGLVGCVSNYKGGVGKTIISINIAAALSIKKKKILLIDSDPQSDSTRALLKVPIDTSRTLYQCLDPENENHINLEDYIYPTIHGGLKILPNITETSSLEIPLAMNFPESNLLLRKNIRDYVVRNFDFTFIDCPPTLSMFVSNALYTSDFVIIPMDAGSGNSLEGIRGVLDLMKTVRSSGNSDLNIAKILCNKIDKRKSTHKANIEDAYSRFGKNNIFATTIPTSSKFEFSEAVQMATIFSIAPTSKGATQFRSLAKEFLSLLKVNM